MRATWYHQTMMTAIEYLQTGVASSLVDSAAEAASGAMQDMSKSVSRTSLDIELAGARAVVPVKRGSSNGIEATLGAVRLESRFGELSSASVAAHLSMASVSGGDHQEVQRSHAAGTSGAAARSMEVHCVTVSSLHVHASDELSGSQWS